MELQKDTRKNIVITTGCSMKDLLEKSPVENSHLNILKRHHASKGVDLLIRGNPQLTLGLVTPIETVDAYFDRKNNTGK